MGRPDRLLALTLAFSIVCFGLMGTLTGLVPRDKVPIVISAVSYLVGFTTLVASIGLARHLHKQEVLRRYRRSRRRVIMRRKREERKASFMDSTKTGV